MPRPILAKIHTNALRSNLLRVKAASPDSKVWAVIKANAYGHGICRVFEGLKGADGFALLDLEEAQTLRDLGWRGPILLLEGAFELRDLELCSRLGLWHTVHCEAQIDMLAAHKTNIGHRVFLKMNTGMNRLGFPPQNYRSAWVRLNALPQVEEVSLMTHFSDADGPGGVQTQMKLFSQYSQDLPGERCLSNSAATLRHSHRPNTTPENAWVNSDWVRPGVALYGSSPDFPLNSASHWGLKPAMSLTSKVIAIQTLQSGDSLGYGGTFIAPKVIRIGIAACGYADGYPRSCGTNTPVLINGQWSRLLGRVSMDMVALDLSLLDEKGHTADIGAEVVLWGESNSGQTLSIDEVAHHAGTVGYELMCGLAPRVPVQVID